MPDFITSILESDPVRRAARTFLQAFLGTLVVVLPTDVVPSLSQVQEVLATAGTAGVIALVTYIQNALEERGAISDRRSTTTFTSGA